MSPPHPYILLKKIHPSVSWINTSVFPRFTLWTRWISAGRPAAVCTCTASTPCCSTCTTRWRSSTTRTPPRGPRSTTSLWPRGWQVGPRGPAHSHNVTKRNVRSFWNHWGTSFKEYNSTCNIDLFTIYKHTICKLLCAIWTLAELHFFPLLVQKASSSQGLVGVESVEVTCESVGSHESWCD